IRTTRKDTPVIYSPEETFSIGGSKIVRTSEQDSVTVVATGITVHEAIKAYEELEKEKIFIRIIDAYSVKPLDKKTLNQAAFETKAVLVVEDHYPEGGLYEAVSSALNKSFVPVYGLAITKLPRSGKPEELMAYEKIDADAIAEKVKKIISQL
ncbi:MAG TPA: transketolase C-terminal domain-containing protein, partial [Patescibacteria group bacterium]|nr:transketolase C-terminal domain-containing protein [Patescibacteria group bacterium]